MSAKYGPNLHFAICGDMNRFNINPVLSLSPTLKQLIDVPTRKNPDVILENIISTLEYFYIPPFRIQPLDSDADKTCKPSDHLPVVFKPININENKPQKYRVVKYRPITESGLNCTLKAEKLQSLLFLSIRHFLVWKVLKTKWKRQALDKLPN